VVIIILNGEFNTYISGDIYLADGIFKNDNDEIIGSLSGIVSIENMKL
jgi:hypothetical protein